MHKIIFLDIDGVLNHQLFYEEKTQAERYKEVGHPDCDLDDKAIDLINDLVKDTGAEIVISSTWRKGKSIEFLQELLDKHGLKAKIIGKTPVYWFGSECEANGSVSRGEEIAGWMKKYVDEKKIGWSDLSYVILDDDSDMLYRQRNRFLIIDGYCGITYNIVYKAKRILNNEI